MPPLDKEYPAINRTQCTPIHKPQPMTRKKNNTSKPKNKVAKVPEKDFQKQCESYLRAIGQPFIRLPDSLFRSIYASQSVKLHVKSEISNSIAGLPDLMIPFKTKRGVLMLSIELKTSTGKLGQKQVKWQKHLDTVVVYGDFEEFKKIVDNFLKENE